VLITAKLHLRPASTASSITWEESPCPLCASEHYQTVLEAADHLGSLRFAMVRCDGCRLHFTNPRPDPSSMGQFYTGDFSPYRSPRLLRSLHRTWRPLARIFGRPCPERRRLPWLGQGRLLDFGCGGGSFLLRMQDQGWKVLGMDRNIDLVKQLRDRVGVKAIAGSLPHPELVPQSFDVVTMWSSLAHVHEPLATLREAYRLLVPGGRLYVEVPNIDSLSSSWFGGHWAGLDLPRHLTHFAPKPLRAMCEAAGFHVLSLRSVSHPDWLRRSAQIARRASGSIVLQLWRLAPVARFVAWIGYLLGRGDGIMAVAERPA
jgi:2-polyprenyl-3-methyl-5-hydroxy-6-metoxy-1,4-benzoquinol methylase